MNSRFLLLIVVLLLVGAALLLWLRPANPPAPPLEVPEPAARDPQFLVLAASWQPAFCETAPRRPECTSMTGTRFDAGHFALHGLWPQDEYCGVAPATEQLDRDSRWDQLPPVALAPDLRRTLDLVMPGTRSHLDRHEWIKHGTCYGTDETAYYAAATALLADLNASGVRELFSASIGRTLTRDQVAAAFDAAFGAGAGRRIRLACDDDGRRTIIGEITVGLWGAPGDAPDLGGLILAARPTQGGCAGGIVDPAGLQ